MADTSTEGIQITKSKEAPGEASFRVEVAAERIAKAETRAASEFAKRARLPGFRKGKAPLPVIRRRYADAIRDQVLREVISESWKVTLDQEKLEPLADPHVHDLKFEAGTPLTFELHSALLISSASTWAMVLAVEPNSTVISTGFSGNSARAAPIGASSNAATAAAGTAKRRDMPPNCLFIFFSSLFTLLFWFVSFAVVVIQPPGDGRRLCVAHHALAAPSARRWRAPRRRG